MAKKISKKTTKKTTATKKVVKKKAAKKAAAPMAKKKAAKKAPAKKSTPTKVKTKTPAATEEATPKPIVKGKKLSKKELMSYRAMLLIKRTEILGDMTSMSAEALADDADLSHMPQHMADVGSDNYEQELTLGLVESERKLLEQIDGALERIREGTYGICEGTGQAIGEPRLQAKPWARYCIEYAREQERLGHNN